jgi:hypothetical protein
MRRTVISSVLTSVLLLAAAAFGQQAVDFSGRVFDADTKRGVENLEVKLTPPRSVRASIRIASTDRNGAFVFPKLIQGRYLIEVSQGVNLLYRAEVDTTKVSRLDVPLRRKR